MNNFKYIYFVEKEVMDYDLIDRLSEINFGFFKYDDSEFCLFAKYPVNTTIFYIISTPYKPAQCTCTMAYLLMNIRYNNITRSIVDNYYQNNGNYKSIYSECIEKMNDFEFIKFINECNFHHRLEDCKTYKNYFNFQLNIYDLIEYVKLLKFIFSIIGTPIVSLIGIFLNVLIIMALIKRKRDANLTITYIRAERTFDYIFLNTLVNLFNCFLSSIKFTMSCISVTGIYCSSIIYTDSDFFLNIILFNFIGSSLRLLSTFTSLMFSLTRYLSINQHQNHFLIKLKSNLAFIILSLASIILNLNKLILNDRLIFYFTNLDKKFALSSFKGLFEIIFSNYYIINIFCLIFNDFLVILIIILIDFMILFKKKNIRKKLNHLRKSKTEKNLNKLIIFNGLFSFMFKLPDMIFNLIWAYHNFNKKSMRFCFARFNREDSVCLNMIEVADFFYVLSFSFDFFLLIKFNIQFKTAFKQLFQKKLNV